MSKLKEAVKSGKLTSKEARELQELSEYYVKNENISQEEAEKRAIQESLEAIMKERFELSNLIQKLQG